MVIAIFTVFALLAQLDVGAYHISHRQAYSNDVLFFVIGTLTSFIGYEILTDVSAWKAAQVAKDQKLTISVATGGVEIRAAQVATVRYAWNDVQRLCSLRRSYLIEFRDGKNAVVSIQDLTQRQHLDLQRLFEIVK